jgi:hypothetical protein
MGRSVVRVLGFTAAILSVSTLARAECSKDTDCKGDRVCTASVCVDPQPAVVASPDPASSQASPVAQQAASPPVVAAPTKQHGQARKSAPHRASGGMTTTGASLFVFGLVLAAAGGGMMYIGATQAQCSDGETCSTVWKAGIGVLALGGVLTIVGLSVWVVGGSEDRVAVTRKRLVPYVNVGLSGGSAGFQF